jgi:uncharacterized protein (TIGR02598 family)
MTPFAPFGPNTRRGRAAAASAADKLCSTPQGSLHAHAPSLQRRHPFAVGALAGFSLVEVVMAVAIAALGIITVLGLIPGSLTSIREAAEITSRTRIISTISAEIQMSDWGRRSNGPVPWSGLQTFLEQKWHFDDQANPLPTEGQDLGTQQAYLARVRSPEQRVALSGQTTPNPDIVNLILDIAAVGDPSYDFPAGDGGELSPLVQSFPVIIARRYATGR